LTTGTLHPPFQSRSAQSFCESRISRTGVWIGAPFRIVGARLKMRLHQAFGKSFLLRETPECAVFASYLIRLRPSPKTRISRANSSSSNRQELSMLRPLAKRSVKLPARLPLRALSLIAACGEGAAANNRELRSGWRAGGKTRPASDHSHGILPPLASSRTRVRPACSCPTIVSRLLAGLKMGWSDGYSLSPFLATSVGCAQPDAATLDSLRADLRGDDFIGTRAPSTQRRLVRMRSWRHR
jgi:hypothetical protein